MSCLALPCVTLALYDLPAIASFDLVTYAAILLSDLAAKVVMGEPARLHYCVAVVTEGLSG